MRPRLHFPTLVLGTFGGLLTLYGFRHEWIAAQEHARREYEERVEDGGQGVFLAFERDLAAILAHLDALVAFHAGSEQVEEHEFRMFAEHTLRRATTARGLHQADLRRTEGQDWPPVDLQVRFSATARTSTEPLEERINGPETWGPLVEALLQDGQARLFRTTPEPDDPHIFVAQAVFDPPPADDSLAARQQAFTSVALIDASLGGMMRQALAAPSRALEELGGAELLLFAIDDEGDPPSRLRIASDEARPEALPPLRLTQASGGPHVAHRPELPGARWLLVLRPVQPPAGPPSQTRAWIVLLAGVSITTATCLTIYSSGSRNRLVTQLVTARTAQLEEASRSLSASERRYRDIVDNSVEGILTLSESGAILSANPAASRIFGAELPALLGQPIAELLPGLGLPGTIDWTPTEALRGAQERVAVEAWAGPLQLVDEAGFLLVVRDTSERRAVERMKDEFVATVSHELRTPLTSILGALEMIKDGLLGPIPPSAARMVTVAYDSGEHLLRIINDILDIERMAAGVPTIRPEAVSANELIERLTRTIRGFADRHGVVLARDLVEPSPVLYGDPERLLQVLTNLVGNAVKFSSQGTQVLVRARQVDDMVQISVRDQGIGIDESFRDRVFQPFSQGDSSDRRSKGGTGLGLSISRAIVLAHQGQIWFESEPARGTTFTITIPAAPQEG
jgi:signal transduction histidine kinase